MRECLAHSFDRFYVVMKFILPTASDINFSKLKFKNDCEYLRYRSKGHNHRKEQCMTDLIEYCRKIIPYVYFYKQQIKSLNDTAHNILKNEINIILPKFLENRKERYLFHAHIRNYRFSLFRVSLVFYIIEGINALHKAVQAIDSKATIQHVINLCI